MPWSTLSSCFSAMSLALSRKPIFLPLRSSAAGLPTGRRAKLPDRVAVARAALRLVDRPIDLTRVLAAGALVDLVARLLQQLVDLVVVLVEHVLGLVEKAHDVSLEEFSTPTIRRTRGSARISERPAGSGIRQFGYSSVVPGRLGWRTSSSTSYSDAMTSRLGVDRRNACIATTISSFVASGPSSFSSRSSSSSFWRSASA